jgi:hypothetical protein
MAEAPFPDRPNIQNNVSPWLKVPGHADVLIRSCCCCSVFGLATS